MCIFIFKIYYDYVQMHEMTMYLVFLSSETQFQGIYFFINQWKIKFDILQNNKIFNPLNYTLCSRAKT